MEGDKMLMLEIVVKIVASVVIADFLSGFFHWLEDAYGQEDWPITGNLITKPNILHHHDPRYFTRYSWLYSARVLLVMGAIVLALAYMFGFLNGMTVLVVLVGINANEVHKWAHRTKAENGRVITFLQQAGLLQSAAHHATHHTDPKNTYYCVLTNFLNPVLEWLGLWAALEAILELLLGIRRRPDHSVKRGAIVSTSAPPNVS
jgi:ubiquitin-conjugating enzyme E2 variant